MHFPAIRQKNFLGTVVVNATDWQVYKFELKGFHGTMAIRREGDQWAEVGLFEAGHLAPRQVIDKLAGGKAEQHIVRCPCCQKGCHCCDYKGHFDLDQNA